MNRIIKPLLLLCLVCQEKSLAQEKITTLEFMVDGLKVIYKKVPKEMVSAKLFVRGGTANYDKLKEGIEHFAFKLAATGGTLKMHRILFATETEKIGCEIDAYSEYDFSVFDLLCLKKTWDRSWELFTDAILQPRFDEKEFKLMKEQLIAATRQEISDPDRQLLNLAMANVFKGHSYEKKPKGSVESLAGIQLKELQDYYENILGKANTFLVVVGDLEVDSLKEKVRSTLAKLPIGFVSEGNEKLVLTAPRNVIVERATATNYIRGYMLAPKLNHDDGLAIWLGMDLLYERFFESVRRKKGLSYAPDAFYALAIMENPYNVLYVSTRKPTKAIETMVDVINQVKKEGFTERELSNKKQLFLTGHYLGLEAVRYQSEDLGYHELRGGWKASEAVIEKVDRLTVKQVNQVFDRYSNLIHWTYLGKTKDINQQDFLQPSVLADQK